jgi:hypothetical protein
VADMVRRVQGTADETAPLVPLADHVASGAH